MLESAFEQFGLNRKAVRVYLLLAELGKANAQTLSKQTGIARTTVYSILSGLTQRGLVSEERKKATTFFVANQPEALLRIIETEKEVLNRKEQAARELSKELRSVFRSKTFNVPRLQFFEGRKGIESMLHDNFEAWHESLLSIDKTWWGYQDHSFVEKHMEWLKFVWRSKAVDEKIYLYSNQASVEKKLRGQVSGREIRPLMQGLEFESTIWVIGDYIVLIMTRHEPNYAYQIRDPIFAQNLRTVFKLMWAVF